jgi:hypothetical protein
VTGVGCPPASAVYVASYLAPEEGAAKQGHTGWVLPLADRMVDTLDNVPEYATIDPATAVSAGVPAAPKDLWMMMPNGPCKVTIGNYYAAAIDAPQKNIAYGVELSGCAPPGNAAPETAIALASAEPPGQCLVYPPKPVAARLGEFDDKNHWSRPAKQTEIPAAIASQIPAHDCTAPACEKLWSVGQIDIGGKPVAWSVAVNWLATGDEAKQCEWKAESFSGFFVAGADGAPAKITDSQEHPLPLFAVLADGSGPKIVLASGPGEYTAYDYAGGQLVAGRHLVWLRPHPDSWDEIDHLGPVCP